MELDRIGRSQYDTASLRIFLRGMSVIGNQPLSEGEVMRRLIIVFALVVLTLSVTAGTVLAGKGGSDRPFAGNSSGTSTFPDNVNEAGDILAPDDVTGIFHNTSEGTFIASHLGKGTFTGESTQNWLTGSPSGICGDVTGTIVLTAANGDTISGDVVSPSTVCELDPPNDLTLYESTLHIDIISGTGRFAGASGDFVSTSTHTKIDAGSASVDIGTWSGSITY